MNKLLGEIATPKTIGRLIFALSQTGGSSENKLAIDEALIACGKKAHGALLKALRVEIVNDRSWQTNKRKNILTVLAVSGDESCAAAIRELGEFDPLVTEGARLALAAIAARHPGVSVPDPSKERPLPLKRLNPTGDSYVDECFQIPFDEFLEERQWHEMPEAEAIPKAVRHEEALALCEALRQKHPDFYFSYYWFAILHARQRDFESARTHLSDGLQHSRSKHELCEMRAGIEQQSGRLSEAVKWWVRASALQAGCRNMDSYECFLELSYVAEATGLPAATDRLRRCIDVIRSGGIRLRADAAEERFAAARLHCTPSMKQAISLLATEYLDEFAVS